MNGGCFAAVFCAHFQSAQVRKEDVYDENARLSAKTEFGGNET